jgi:hypothetical protein
MRDPRYDRYDINQTTWRQFGCFAAMALHGFSSVLLRSNSIVSFHRPATFRPEIV